MNEQLRRAFEAAQQLSEGAVPFFARSCPRSTDAINRVPTIRAINRHTSNSLREW